MMSFASFRRRVCRRSSFRFSGAVLAGTFALLLLASPLRAHDPYESFGSAVVREDHMELVITMASVTAARLIESSKKMVRLNQETFPELKPRLAEAAEKLCAFSSDKAVLKPRKVDVEYSEENDVTFKVVYPRPAPGKLLLHTGFLESLGDGYGAIMEVADNAGNHLGWDQLNAQYSRMEVTVLPHPPAKKP